jgi:uncharacterized protein YjbJ (UPF0337 family)
MKRISFAVAAAFLIGGIGVAHALDSDRVEGTGKQIKGNIEQGAGVVTGDQKLQDQGKSDQSAGKLQNAWGKTKDAVRDVGTEIKNAIEGK